MTGRQFEESFPLGDDEAPKAYLKARRWPSGVRCPRCGNEAVYDLPSRKWHWQCTKCAPGGSTGYRFSVIAGTIFENTNKPLRDWFKVVHLMTTSKKGISALQIQRQMGFGSYETAHSMCHKIRAAMMKPQEKLGGIVEVDETYVGGDDKNRHWDKKKGKGAKMPVIGAVQRKGNVVARVLGRARKTPLSRSSLRQSPTKFRCSRRTRGPDIRASRLPIHTAPLTIIAASMLLARSIPTRLKAFGRSSSAALLVRSTKYRPNTCRFTLPSFSFDIITA